MDVFDTIAEWIRPTAHRLDYFMMDNTRVRDETLSPLPAVAEEHYFQVFAYTAHLAHSRDWFNENLPAVATVVHEEYGNTSKDHVRVSGPSDLASINATSMGKTVVVNRPMTPLLPFRGGTLSVVAGLIAFQVEDNLGKLIDVVSDITALAGGPSLRATAQAIGAVTQSVSALFSTGTKDLMVSLDHTWTGNSDGDGGPTTTLREGYWVLLNRSADSTHDDLWLKDGQLQRGAMSSQTTPLEGVDYMVIRLALSAARDDWLDFCRDEIGKRDEALLLGDVQQAQVHARAAAHLIYGSDAFTNKDRRTRVSEILSESGLLTPPQPRIAEGLTAELELEAALPTLDELRAYL